MWSIYLPFFTGPNSSLSTFIYYLLFVCYLSHIFRSSGIAAGAGRDKFPINITLEYIMPDIEQCWWLRMNTFRPTINCLYTDILHSNSNDIVLLLLLLLLLLRVPSTAECTSVLLAGWFSIRLFLSSHVLDAHHCILLADEMFA